MSDMVTIREAVSRTKEDGIPISEYTLRQWVRTGAIPSRKAGTKTLLFYPNLVSYLRCEDSGNNVLSTVKTTSDIHRCNSVR